MLTKCFLVNLRRSHQGKIRVFSYKIKNNLPNDNSKFCQTQMLFFFLEVSTMELRSFSKLDESFKVLAVGVSLVDLFDGGHDPIEPSYLFLIIMEKFWQKLLRAFGVEEGEGLIDDIWFCIFFLVQCSFLFGSFPNLEFLIDGIFINKD